MPHVLTHRWSLVTALTWGASAVLALALALVMALSLRAGTRSAEELLMGWAVSVVTSVADRLSEHLQPVRTQTAYLAELIARTARGDERIAELIATSQASSPQISGTLYVRPDGSGIVVRAPADEKRTIHAFAAGNAETAPLATVAEGLRRAGARDGRWGEVVRGRRGGDSVVNFRQPVWNGERFLGLLTSGVRTSELSSYLEQISAPNDAVAFVLLGEDQVVAASSLDMRKVRRREGAALPLLKDVDDPALRAMWEPLDPGLQGGRAPAAGFELRVQALEDGRRVAYLFQYVHHLGPTPWIVGCYFEGEQYDEALRRIRWAAAASLAVLTLTALATFLGGRGLGRPILRLARAAQAIRDAGPQAAQPLPPSRLLEIDTASQAFNGMVEGLRERERLRATFGRYVPESVADALIADGGVLQPQTRVCTTVFTDIVGFSSISERLTPQELIGVLNEYFSVVAEPIERHGGVIHQFQGDGILITYNLPVAQDAHAENAVRSAIEIQAATRGRTFGPGVELATRIGINTGPAVCGTVGGAGRLGFTVHGDDVNLAARIEEMNKSFGTLVLVAGSTVDAVRGAFEFTRVGEIPVRGRQRSVVVFRVAGPHTVDEKV